MKYERGMTLLEVMVAMAVLVVVTLGLSQAYFTMEAYRGLTSEKVRASNLLRTQLERVVESAENGTALGALVTTYSQTANADFTCDELASAAGTTVLHLNESQVPVELGGSPVTLTDADGYQYGPLDLNGDGDTGDNFTGTTDAQLVPVEVRIAWNSNGTNMILRKFVLMSRLDEES